MPSTSKSQQRLMGIAYSVKKGDTKISDVDSSYRDKVQELVDSMSLKQLKDFASTPHKDLPESRILSFSEFITENNLNENLVITITKNTEPAPKMGNKYGQDVEPKGTYVLAGTINRNGYINGKANLKNPLFIDITDDTVIQYKRDLAEKYKAKGQKLTNKLMKLGHDAIITVYEDGTYGEIVLFPNASFMLN